MKKSIVILYGPTGVGKTDCALKLAQAIDGEIINMDMGALYAPLTIGTAKPDWRSYPIAHHLFDIIDSPRNLTVVEYRALVLPLIQNIWQRKKVPILVGGSGFYLKSLFFPPTGAPVSSMGSKYSHISDEKLWDHLHDIDEIRANAIDRNDLYRIKRALDIWYSMGIKPSLYRPKFDPIASFILFFLTRDRNELYARIDQRVHEMIASGWKSEVMGLIEAGWAPFIKEKKIIGYDDLLDYLESEQTSSDEKSMTEKIQKKTRNYAKRQLTFWRSLQKDLQDSLAEYTDSNLIAKSLIKELNVSDRDCVSCTKRMVQETLS